MEEVLALARSGMIGQAALRASRAGRRILDRVPHRETRGGIFLRNGYSKIQCFRSSFYSIPKAAFLLRRASFYGRMEIPIIEGSV